MHFSVATFMRANAPSYHLRFKSIFEFLRTNGKLSYQETIKTYLGKYRTISFKKETDVIFIARIIDPEYLRKIFSFASDNRIPIIYETDDLLLFDRRSDGPAKEHGALSEYLAKVSGVITSTQYLADELKKYNRRVFLFPNLLDPKIWNAAREERRGNSGRLNICCIGTGIMPENLRLIVPAMEYCQKAYGRDVIFHLWGNDRYIENDVRSLKNVKLIDGKVAYTKFAARLQASCFDMAIAPLSDSMFNRAKSNIKYLEYSISGIPALFSRVRPYGSLNDGGSCMLVENDPDDWRDKIAKLIGSEELRQRLSAQARDDVLKNYILNEARAENYMSILRDFYEH
ncbi:MAG: glycosyltransferase [Nitrospirae bacterium]|nr:glycosyltransferase [Nitrospirota bacterium]